MLKSVLLVSGPSVLSYKSIDIACAIGSLFMQLDLLAWQSFLPVKQSCHLINGAFCRGKPLREQDTPEYSENKSQEKIRQVTEDETRASQGCLSHKGP
mmetsp:Transcript_40591/g.160981  ORF Transcript_40591/g.160981 Transcript_40591/m.160981 type:complete len:98 (+) Transcript_40591:1249-1542(+)